MLSETDMLILAKLQSEYPEAYEMFIRREKQHQDTVKTGCHDIRNIVTLLSGSYQLLSISNPQLKSIPRFKQMGDDIKVLVNAFNDITAYRYAASISPASTDIRQLVKTLREYINETYHNKQQFITMSVEPCMQSIYIDLTRISIAICRLIDNAVEACPPIGTFPLVNISIAVISSFGNGYDNKANSLAVTVSNYGDSPSKELVPYMFDPFSTDKAGHLGLGLAIVNESTHACNGKISWNCSDGVCRFNMVIPC